eukprot:31083-Pelagococcus_subviridis.AAC.24
MTATRFRISAVSGSASAETSEPLSLSASLAASSSSFSFSFFPASPSLLFRTYNARHTPFFRSSAATLKTSNPCSSTHAVTSSTLMPPSPSHRCSHTATTPLTGRSVFLAKTSKPINISFGVAECSAPSPTPTAADRTPYGKSVTIASTSPRCSSRKRWCASYFSSALVFLALADGVFPSAAVAGAAPLSSSPAVSVSAAAGSSSSRGTTSSCHDASSSDARLNVALPATSTSTSLSARVAASNAYASTSHPMARLAPNFNAARSTAPPPTHGSKTTSPGLTLAALTARNACSGGIAFGAST